jgi:two-component system, NtrC family, sensor kinase
MKQLLENTLHFRSSANRVLTDMFGLTDIAMSDAVETPTVETDKSFIVSIYYTGTVYGEYQLAMDQETAARILGIEGPIDDSNRELIQEQICDAFSEVLNMIVGESLVHLQSTYAKLTLTPPRVFFGRIRYPKFRTGRSILTTSCGTIECHFCLDLMRLDLATSYNDALQSLLEVNSKLKQANQHLAEQQSQLVHSEKMATVGMLASGIAHEINNPLFFVESNLSTLNDYVGVIESMVGLYENLCISVRSGAHDYQDALAALRNEGEQQDIEFVLQDTNALVKETREGVRRIKTIVKGLKDFSHTDIGGIADADLNQIINNTLSLVAHEWKDRCEFILDSQELPRVVCNVGEIGQVLLHMILNAAQSIDDKGKVAIATYALASDAVIVIEDSGRGIPSDVLDRIFDPFFTTKEEGKGVGLGLSIAYGIIRKHNGSISVESKLGQGTKFTVRLPLLSQAAPSTFLRHALQ